MTDAHDVIVVGAGPAAVSAAWPLVERGLNVCMIDAGPALRSEPERLRPTIGEVRRGEVDNWRWLLGDQLAGLDNSLGGSPKLRLHSGSQQIATYAAANRLQADGYVVIGSLAPGGLSRLWGAATPSLTDEELTQLRLPTDAMRRSYRNVAERIGISGCATDDLARFESDSYDLQPPIPLSPNAAAVLDRYQAKKDGMSLVIGRPRQAVLSSPSHGRKACSACGGCLWGCSEHAIYNSAFELPHLARFGNFRLISEAIAESVKSIDDDILLTARDAKTDQQMTFRASYVVLAAGVFASTRIALDYLGMRDSTLAFENTPAFAMACLHPRRIGAALPDRVFAMAQLNLRLALAGEAGEYAWGVIYDASSVASSDLAAYCACTMPGVARIVRSFAPALSIVLCYFPGSYSRNSVQLMADTDGRGSRLVIRGGLHEAYRQKCAEITRKLRHELVKLGMFPLPGSLRQYAPGEEAHAGATLPIGKWTTDDGALVANPRIYVADASVLPRMPAKHHTFTVMANADRIGRALAGRFAFRMIDGGRMAVPRDGGAR